MYFGLHLLTPVVTSVAATSNSTKLKPLLKYVMKNLLTIKLVLNALLKQMAMATVQCLSSYSPQKETVFMGWMQMWFYSNASIMVDDWNYEGKVVNKPIGYIGLFEFNETTYTYTVNDDALFCFARGK
ncbi:MAG TPA: hypothetical protein EYP23_03825 [Thermoplasmata archaeon]|nr:hypothetical protein [Thermoplasmata archaeon]